MAFESPKRLVLATIISLIGLRDAFRSEPAFPLELLVLLVVIPVAWIRKSAGVERALLIGSWMLVLAAAVWILVLFPE